ncbi:pilus assembly protein [bacterium]|nr:pilus assembly protein [bacterium]
MALINLFYKGARRSLGQSTVEMALMMPILAFLLLMIFQGFRLNDKASQRQIVDHDMKLKQFDHGNGTLDIAGSAINTDNTIDLISFDPVDDIGDILLDIGTNLAIDLGLNKVFSELDFFQKDTFISGAAKGAITESAHQLVNNGVDGFKFESVAWAAGTGGLASGQSSEFFQGKDVEASSWREALGSSVQYGAIGFTSSEGDPRQIALGAVQGLNTSDTVASFENTKFDILTGAAKGALQATVSGAVSGTLNGKTVLISSGLGAYNTKTVAEFIPLSNWRGDARQSAIFTASNAALSAWASGGDAASIATAGVTGAIGSHQTMVWKYQLKEAYKEKVNQHLNAAGLGASASFTSGAVETAATFTSFEQTLSQAISQAKSTQDINQYFQNPQTIEQASQVTQNMFSSQQAQDVVGQIIAATLMMQSQNNDNNTSNSSSSTGESP